MTKAKAGNCIKGRVEFEDGVVEEVTKCKGSHECACWAHYYRVQKCLVFDEVCIGCEHFIDDRCQAN